VRRTPLDALAVAIARVILPVTWRPGNEVPPPSLGDFFKFAAKRSCPDLHQALALGDVCERGPREHGHGSADESGRASAAG
jgi:hypothetical protein